MLGKHSMLSDLIKVIGTLEYEHNGQMQLISTIEKGKDIELIIKLFTGVECTPPQFWKVCCVLVQEHQLILGQLGAPFGLYKEHILLWAHEDRKVSLFFNGKSKDTFSIIGALYIKHRELVEHYVPFQRYINNYDLVKLISNGHGVLAEGPERLIIAYQHVMDEFGFTTSVLPLRDGYQIGSKYITPQGKGQNVLLMGSSYIIATNVEVSREQNIKLDSRIEIIWKFVRGEILVNDFEKWTYSEESLATLLGDALYLKILSANYSDEKAISQVKQLLYDFIKLQFI